MATSSKGSSKDNFDLDSGGESPLAPPSPRHYWEDDVFSGEAVPEELRRGFQYSGVPRSLSAKPDEVPLLLAGVNGIDDKGTPFRWLARRHRKGLYQEHLCPTPAAPISWLGWLDVRQYYHKTSWWVAMLFTIGSLLFVISGVANEVRSVSQPDDPTPGLRSPFAALIGWPNAVAANLFFFPGGLLQLWETTNMDMKSRLLAWDAHGRKDPRPRHHFLPYRADLYTVSWWAVVIQLSGMLGFNMATIVSLLSSVINLKPNIVNWCINFGFTYGGAAFTASAVLFCVEATGSWWRGLLPTRLSDLRKISWHAVFWSFQGSVGFLIGGAAGYATSFSWTQMQWITGYGDLGGAVWFLLSSLAALLEQVNPKHP